MTQDELAAEPARRQWKCGARQRHIGAEIQDCDWPVCGCDPYASKVLDAIEESGFEIVRKQPVGHAQCPADYGKMSVDMAIEACARTVDEECERMLAQQYPASATGMEFTDTINTNIRMMACILPNIAGKIRALAQGPDTSTDRTSK